MLQDSGVEDQRQVTCHRLRAGFNRPLRLVILTLNVVKGKDLLFEAGHENGCPILTKSGWESTTQPRLPGVLITTLVNPHPPEYLGRR